MRANHLAVLALTFLLGACTTAPLPAPVPQPPAPPMQPQIIGSADHHVLSLQTRLVDANRTLVADTFAVLPDGAPLTFGLTGMEPPAPVPGISGVLRTVTDGAGVRFDLALSLTPPASGPLDAMNAHADRMRVISVADGDRLLSGETIHHAIDADTGVARRFCGRSGDPALDGAELEIQITLLRRADVSPQHLPRR